MVAFVPPFVALVVVFWFIAEEVTYHTGTTACVPAQRERSPLAVRSCILSARGGHRRDRLCTPVCVQAKNLIKSQGGFSCLSVTSAHS